MNKCNKTAIFSVILLLAVLFSACAQSNDNTDQTNGADTTMVSGLSDEVTELTDEYGRPYIEDGVPADLDFEGVNVNILVRDDDNYKRDFYAEDINGEVVNDAIYDRNRSVEEALNVKLNILYGAITNTSSSEAVGDMLRQSVLAGDNAYDIVAYYAFYGTTLAAEGMLYDILDTKYIDLSKPWWNNNLDELTLDNHNYYLIGDVNASATNTLMGVFFNQSQIVNYYNDYEFLYQLVYDGGWTFDKFVEILSDKYTDINADGIANEGDFFGLLTVEDNPGPWVAALGIRLAQKDSKGVPQLSLYSERSVTIYEKLYDLYRNNQNVNFAAKGYNPDKAFASGQGVFVISMLRNASIEFRDMADGYGLLPMPKYDVSQEGYYNHFHDNANIIGISTTAQNPDMVSAVLELLGAESYRSVTPAYYEIAMKVKYLADSDSAKMFDMILDGSIIDFGQIFSHVLSGSVYDMNVTYHVLFRNMIRTKTTDFTSLYSKNENIYQTNLQELLDTFSNIGK